MDNMLKIEQGTTPGALASGQRPEGLGPGGQTPKDLGPGEVEKMFGPAPGATHEANAGLTGSAAWLKGLEVAEKAGGGLASLGEGMGGGGGAIDAIDDWVVQKGGYDGLLRQIQQNGWPDNAAWKLPDGTQLSVAEVKRRAVVAASPPAPEPQPAPRLADWRDNLPQDQRQRLKDFENRIVNATPQQIGVLMTEIETAQLESMRRKWPDGFWASEQDASFYLRILKEKITKSVMPDIVKNRELIRGETGMEQLSQQAKTHIESLFKEFKRYYPTIQLPDGDYGRLAELVSLELVKADMLGVNPPSWVLPPSLKEELNSYWGLKLNFSTRNGLGQREVNGSDYANNLMSLLGRRNNG